MKKYSQFGQQLQMIFALPCSLRKHIWRLCLQMRNMELKRELLIQRKMHKQTYDMLANHHHLDEKYLHHHAQDLGNLFYKLFFLSPKPIIGISAWTKWVASSKKILSKKVQDDVCELLAAIILQYVHITKSAELSSLQVTEILTLHDDLMMQN